MALNGSDGKRIQADDGNANMIFDVTSENGPIAYKNGTIKVGSQIIVSSTGKLRTGGVVRVDGVKYEISVEDGVWKVTEKDN